MHWCTAEPGQQPWADQASDAHQQAAEPQAVAEEDDEEDYDPYAPLDPHAKGSLPIKPFKKGRKPSRRKRHKQAGSQLGNNLGLPHVRSNNNICPTCELNVLHLWCSIPL